ncbi:hypothetical protein M9458_038292, partial [Cirrhinus mrigala]
MYIYFTGNKGYRGWVPVTCSRELPAVSAPAHAGLLAEGEDGETHLHPDPQRSQQDYEEPGQHRVLHPGTQDPRLICITSRTNASLLPFIQFNMGRYKDNFTAAGYCYLESVARMTV